MAYGCTRARAAPWGALVITVALAAPVLSALSPAAADDLVDLPILEPTTLPAPATTLPAVAVPVTGPRNVVPTLPPKVDLLRTTPSTVSAPPSSGGSAPSGPGPAATIPTVTTVASTPTRPSSTTPAAPATGGEGAEAGPAVGPDGPAPRALAVRLRTAAADTARQLTFPLGLSVGILAFLVFQHRLDRDDHRIGATFEFDDGDLLGFS